MCIYVYIIFNFFFSFNIVITDFLLILLNQILFFFIHKNLRFLNNYFLDIKVYYLKIRRKFSFNK